MPLAVIDIGVAYVTVGLRSRGLQPKLSNMVSDLTFLGRIEGLPPKVVGTKIREIPAMPIPP